MAYFVAGVEMEIEHCCKCGIVFAITKALKTRRLNDHKSFYCPNGHGQYFSEDNEVEELKRRLKQEENCCINAKLDRDYYARASRAYKGHFNRIKKTPTCGKTD